MIQSHPIQSTYSTNDNEDNNTEDDDVGHLTEANIPSMFDSMGQLHSLLHLFVKDIITIVDSVVFVVFVIFVVNIIIVLIIVKRILMLQ